MAEDNKKDRKNWTVAKKTESELSKGYSVDLKKSNQYQLVLTRKKEFLFSF
jgi:hypothetical protein